MNKVNKINKSRKCIDKEAELIMCNNGAEMISGLVPLGPLGYYLHYSTTLIGFNTLSHMSPKSVQQRTFVYYHRVPPRGVSFTRPGLPKQRHQTLEERHLESLSSNKHVES